MKKLAMLLPAALLFAACSDIPSEPPVAGPSFDNPPPPKLGGRGFVSLGDVADIAALSLTIQALSCEDLGSGALAVAFPIDGNYFQNPPGTHAWVNFSPVGGSGQAWIREHGKALPNPLEDLTLDAGGSVKYNQDGIDYQVHVLSYEGPPLRRPEGSDAAGGNFGELTAEVRACGRREIALGSINFNWGPIVD